MTTDHGWGEEPIDYWSHHGSNVEGAEKVWIAVMGPDTPATGEANNSRTIYSSQIAKTISTMLGVEYINKEPVGDVIKGIIRD